MKKIFYIFPHLQHGEFEKRIHERINRERFIVKYSRSLGYNCQLCRMTINKNFKQLNDDVGTSLFPVDNPQNTNSFQFVSSELLEYINYEKPDLVVFKGMAGYKLTTWLFLKAKVKFKIAFIVAGGIKELLLPWADYVLAETQNQIDEKIKRCISKNKIDLLPKLNLASTISARVGEKKYDIVNVGTFVSHKNQIALLPFAKKYKIALVGDGELLETVKKEAKDYQNNITFFGNLERDEVLEVVASSKVMVHTALQEGFPRVILEAFSVGVPVVAFQQTMPNAFEHDKVGMLVEKDELYIKVEELLQDDARIESMGRNAFAYANSSCNEENIAKVVDVMYRQVLEEKKQSHISKKDIFLIMFRFYFLQVGKYIKSFFRNLKDRNAL